MEISGRDLDWLSGCRFSLDDLADDTVVHLDYGVCLRFQIPNVTNEEDLFEIL